VATGDWRRIPNEYARGHVHVFGPYLYRSEFWARTPEEETERALHHLERVILAEGSATIAAILLETIPGTAGVLVPPAGYLAGVRAIADRYGIVLILDEVMAGFARTGQWFAFDAFDVRPDLITFAKGVNSGYVPVGGVIVSDAIAYAFDDRVFPGGLTYSGHPLAAASIVASLTAMEEEGVVANAARIAPTFSAQSSPISRPATNWWERCAVPVSSGRSNSSATGRPGNRSPRPRCPSSSEPCWNGVCCRSSSTTGSTWCRLR
jgi:taurine---2-oxoglutarate transaminase